MSRHRRSLLILPLLLALPKIAGAAVLHVPSQYATINQAIDAAVSGDSVLVAPGVYDQYETRLLADGYWYSAVAFLKSGVFLWSEDGPATTTLRLDNTPEAPRLCKAYGLSGMVEVAGFTMTGTAPHIEGVVFANGGRLVLRNCVFENLGAGFTDEVASGTVRSDMEVHGCRFENINGSSGSAINQTSGTLLLEDSEFVNCRSGAMRLFFDSGFPHATGLTMRRCRFLDNVKTSGGGAGLYVSNYADVLIEDCWFEGNRSESLSSAGGAFEGSAWASFIIRGNTFVGNSAELGNGGALWLGSGTPLVTGNTFWENWTDRNHSAGGASVFFALGGELRNNVIAGSTGDEAVGVLQGAVLTGCNVYWDNAQGNTAGFVPDATDLIADPMFCDVAANDFHVNTASPCLPGNGHPSCTDLIGAWGQGCGVVSVEPSSWGRIKNSFRSGSEEAGR